VYSKEEKKKIKRDFWEGFRTYSTPRRRKLGKPKQWVLQNTGIKAIDLKFDIDTKQASVGLDVVSKSNSTRELYWNKLLGLKNILNKEFKEELVWEKAHRLDRGKEIVRISAIKKKVNIYENDCWFGVYAFFFDHMIKFESFFEEYKEIIRVRQGDNQV
jgi:hypothetical protein